ncbi:MAG TPA: peptide-N-glycosidase F-related protein [Bacteroidales bacterium]|nr:peptide-N-glycosidase F-related protein [Bacteroidales bacterium]HSA42046.1 peptide-N-glycosidase F-related protein [Bacteroidales bacterium]
MKLRKLYFSLIPACIIFFNTMLVAGPGDTVVVKTFRFDTSMRQGVFQFPDNPGQSWEKILMLYSMRCKNGLVSNSTYPNQGCGEWDYNCFTYLVDSTQTDSLRTIRNSHDISSFSGTLFPYTTQPVYSWTLYQQQQVTCDTLYSQDTTLIGNAAGNLPHPLATAAACGKAQYLWRAAELSAAGMTAGPVSALRLKITNPGSDARFLRIKLKLLLQDSLNHDAPVLDSLSEAYFLNTSFPADGWITFRFHQPFHWDGLSNLLAEFSFSGPAGGTDNLVSVHDAGFTAGLVNFEPDACLRFSGGIQVMKVNPAFFPQVTDKISIAFWCKGDPAKLPANTSIMEAVDASGKRQVNIHLPWGNSRIYWDCGNDGSNYDRIDKDAGPEEIEGRWNFWTFTKNAVSGEMKIFKNAQLWASGTGKTKPITLSRWICGASVNGSNPYYGMLDELSIWNTDLDSAGIARIMYRNVEATHPAYGHLMAFYRFNEAAGTIASDSGPLAVTSSLINPGWHPYRGEALMHNFTPTEWRPDVVFVNSVCDTSLLLIPQTDSSLLVPSSVISYEVISNNLFVIDTIYVWPAGYAYISSPDGSLLDSIPVTAEDSIQLTQLTYYQRRPMRVELINFITPYGLGLNLNGLTGRTWIFDVTDYAPVLKGPRFMAMSDGIYQEDNDITFVFYEGSPVREVMSLQQIWPSGSWVSPSYNDIYNDKYFEARDIKLPGDADQFKVRSAISGHGQQGEFVPRTHSLTLNDTVNFPFQVWKHCSDNPIYPQGGTWVYERAGWCPGAVVDTREFELTPLVTPGQDIRLDYSLPYNMNPGASNYRVNHQLVCYAPPSFELDARLEYVKQPSDRTEFMRLNPLCNQPLVGFRNTGSTPLTSLDVVYGRQGGTLSTFNWTGNLAFNELQEVSLPMPDWNSSNSDCFIAYVTNPNGGSDQYAYNDSVCSKFIPSQAWPNNLVVELKANNRPWENYLILLNSNGDTVLYHNNLTANQIYRDTLDLPDDCYTIRVFDSGDDGLSFWANTAQGTGYCRIISSLNNTIYKSFNPDFGDNIYLQFRVELALGLPETATEGRPDLSLYPNPVADVLRIDYKGMTGGSLQLSLISITGQIMLEETHRLDEADGSLLIGTAGIPAGTYVLGMKHGTFREHRKIVLLK